MGVRGVICAVLLGGLVFLGPSEPVLAGCNPNREFQDAGARWSPDDRWLAFYRVEVGCGGPIGIWVVRADGSGLRRLGSGGRPSPPTWSPEGRHVAFAGTSGIVATELLGRGLDAVTNGPDFAPAWSPDGKLIAFRRGAAPDAGLWLMNADGSGQRPLVDRLHDVAVPTWSPDSRSIAYVAPGSSSSEDVYVIDVGDGKVVNLSRSAASDRHPDWLPDGTYVAFDSDRVGDRQVYVATREGSRVASVTLPPGAAHDPSFGRTEGRLSYVRDAPQRGLYMTSGPVFEEQLSSRPDVLGAASWSHRGNLLAFSAGGQCLRYGIYLLEVEASPSTERRVTNPCTFRGTPRADALRGTPFRDFLVGLPGDDVLRGLGGPDTLTGGTGRDRLEGGEGADVIVARDGRRDIVSGGHGKDTARVDRGLDRVTDVEKLLP